jgi:hypothetical protein
MTEFYTDLSHFGFDRGEPLALFALLLSDRAALLNYALALSEKQFEGDTLAHVIFLLTTNGSALRRSRSKRMMSAVEQFPSLIQITFGGTP